MDNSREPPPGSPAPKTKDEKGTLRTCVACLLTITLCGGIMGLIGGRGDILQRFGNGAFALFLVILGLFVQCALGHLIGKLIARNETGGGWGAGIAAALYILGILSIISFLKIKAPF